MRFVRNLIGNTLDVYQLTVLGRASDTHMHVADPILDTPGDNKRCLPAETALLYYIRIIGTVLAGVFCGAVCSGRLCVRRGYEPSLLVPKGALAAVAVFNGYGGIAGEPAGGVK